MIELPALFSDGMILQRDMPLAFWGRCDPLARLELRLLGKTYSAVAGTEGRWRISAGPVPAGGPFDITVSLPELGETLTIAGVYAGEVWLCSGQSNMELSMARLKDEYPEEFTLDPPPLIRHYRLPYAWDFAGPRERIPAAKWLAAGPETLADFSGTAWFFARYLQKSRPVPVGLITSAVGGAPAESLMSREALGAYPEKLAEAALYADPAFAEGAVKKSGDAQAAWYEEIRRGDAGLAGAWFRGDAASWRELVLPGFFTKELEHFHGVIWLRKTFSVSSSRAGQAAKVWLGTLVDSDTVYINGKEVGGAGYRYPPRKYLVPQGLLREGENDIVIRLVCRGGDGGVTPGKPFLIFFEDNRNDPGAIALEGRWEYRIGVATGPCPPEFFIHWKPTGLFNGMIAPLLPLSFRGVIWYQGESDTEHAGEYADLFKALIRDWRAKKGGDAGDPPFPFLFVQLPLWGEISANSESSPWAALREAQASALALPATGMAVGLDLGEWNDLHPLNKRDIGRRLALAAEKTVYGASNTAPGPVLQAISRRENTLELRFANCGTGLAVKGGPGGLAYLTVIPADGKARRLPGLIRPPDTLTVDVSAVTAPQKILYAWADNPADPLLYNSDDLPALPFRKEIPS